MAEALPAVPVIAPVLVAQGWESLRRVSWGLFGRGSGRCCIEGLVAGAIEQGDKIICNGRSRYPMKTFRQTQLGSSCEAMIRRAALAVV